MAISLAERATALCGIAGLYHQKNSDTGSTPEKYGQIVRRIAANVSQEVEFPPNSGQTFNIDSTMFESNDNWFNEDNT